MAFPVPAGSASGQTNPLDTAHTVDMSAAGSIASGDGMLVAFAWDQGESIAATFPGGWTLLTAVESGATGGNIEAAFYYRTAGASEPTSFDVTLSSSETSVYRMWRWDSADIEPWSTDPPEAVTTTPGNTATPDPANLAVSWAAGEDNWFATFAAWDQSQTINSYPTGTTDTGTETNGGVTGAWAEKYDTALDAWDPGVFTAAAGDRAITATIAVRAAVVAVGAGTALPVPAEITIEAARPQVVTSPARRRNPYLQPFDSGSIWQMPISRNATTVHASIEGTSAIIRKVTADQEPIQMDSNHSLKDILKSTVGWQLPDNSPAFSADRCAAATTTVFQSVPIPDGWATKPGGNSLAIGDRPNHASAFIDKNGVDVHQFNALEGCGETSPGSGVWKWVAFNNHATIHRIDSDGQYGGHGGSGLSGLGGSIRRGELVPNGHIPHPLKINLNGATNYHWDAIGDGFEHPAIRSDGYADSTTDSRAYGGTNVNVMMGSLLCLPEDFDLDTLVTEPARIIALAMIQYGGYCVDDTTRDVISFSTALEPDGSTIDDFQTDFGFGFESTDATWVGDMRTMFAAMHVVTNQDANNIGGGPNTEDDRERRAPYAAPLELIEPAFPVSAYVTLEAADTEIPGQELGTATPSSALLNVEAVNAAGAVSVTALPEPALVNLEAADVPSQTIALPVAAELTLEAVNATGIATEEADFVPPVADMRTGSVTPFAGTVAPSTALFCDGAEVSRSTYAALFAVIGETYGVGDGATTFTLPDLRQRIPLGKAVSGTGSTLGATGGAIDHGHDLDHDRAHAEIYAEDAPGSYLNMRRVTNTTAPYDLNYRQSGATSAPTAASTNKGVGLQGTTSAADPPYLVMQYLIFI